MNTIFIGGSRHVSRLSVEVKQRLDNVVEKGHKVIVGDANGADKAVQQHLLEKGYNNVTIFCTGDRPRNNLGTWGIQHVKAPRKTKDFQFYAAKDREMAREADFGLMIWDGKSPGTILNVLRLVLAGKAVVMFNVSELKFINIKSINHWLALVSRLGQKLQSDIKNRATTDEWAQANCLVFADPQQMDLWTKGSDGDPNSISRLI